MSAFILINSNSRRPFAAAFSETIRIINYAECQDTLKKPDYLGLALFNLAEELKKKIELKDITAVSINTGPGSFTSIRIGLSLAKGLAVSLNKKLITINGFELLSSRLEENRPGNLLALIPAKRPEFYYCLFKDDSIVDTGCSNIDEIRRNLRQNCKIVADFDNESNLKLDYFDIPILKPVKEEAEAMYELTKQKYEKGELFETSRVLPLYIKEPTYRKL